MGSSMALAGHSGPTEAATTYEDPLDDVFGDDYEPQASHSTTTQNHDESSQTINRLTGEHFDTSRLRTTHVTNGYREGLSESKEQFIQEGFDEGYSLGAVLGSKAGWCLGVLESIAHTAQGQTEDLQTHLNEARSELALQSLFDKRYFGSDGLWTYDVPGHDEGEVTFPDVCAAHPLISKWTTYVMSLARKLDLDFETTREYVRLDDSADGD